MPTADALARQARERALREGNAGHPAAAVRHARAGLKYLGWSEGPAEDDARRVPAAHRALAARLLGIVGQWEPVLGRTGYGLSLLDRAENLAAGCCCSSEAWSTCGSGGRPTPSACWVTRWRS
jgi:hypothetical protein